MDRHQAGPRSRTPSNEEFYDFWANDPRGQALIKHLLSEPQLASSRAATTSALDQLLHGIHDSPAPSDTFMDPCNAKEVDVSEIMDHRKRNPHVETHLAKAFILDLAFPAAHEDANLILAPKALDHLKEFERKRCAAVEAVSSMVGASTDEVKVYVDLWLKTIPDKERQIDAWLSKLYVQLRSWSMAKYLQQHEEFTKLEFIPMLNTLYPPGPYELPSPTIMRASVDGYRASYMRLIDQLEEAPSTERRHSIIDRHVYRRMDLAGSPNSWTSIRHVLKTYLETGEEMMLEARLLLSAGRSSSFPMGGFSPQSPIPLPSPGNALNKAGQRFGKLAFNGTTGTFEEEDSEEIGSEAPLSNYREQPTNYLHGHTLQHGFQTPNELIHPALRQQPPSRALPHPPLREKFLSNDHGQHTQPRQISRPTSPRRRFAPEGRSCEDLSSAKKLPRGSSRGLSPLQLPGHNSQWKKRASTILEDPDSPASTKAQAPEGIFTQTHSKDSIAKDLPSSTDEVSQDSGKLSSNSGRDGEGAKSRNTKTLRTFASKIFRSSSPEDSDAPLSDPKQERPTKPFKKSLTQSVSAFFGKDPSDPKSPMKKSASVFSGDPSSTANSYDPEPFSPLEPPPKNRFERYPRSSPDLTNLEAAESKSQPDSRSNSRSSIRSLGSRIFHSRNSRRGGSAASSSSHLPDTSVLHDDEPFQPIPKSKSVTSFFKEALSKSKSQTFFPTHRYNYKIPVQPHQPKAHKPLRARLSNLTELKKKSPYEPGLDRDAEDANELSDHDIKVLVQVNKKKANSEASSDSLGDHISAPTERATPEATVHEHVAPPVTAASNTMQTSGRRARFEGGSWNERGVPQGSRLMPLSSMNSPQVTLGNKTPPAETTSDRFVNKEEKVPMRDNKPVPSLEYEKTHAEDILRSRGLDTTLVRPSASENYCNTMYRTIADKMQDLDQPFLGTNIQGKNAEMFLITVIHAKEPNFLDRSDLLGPDRKTLLRDLEAKHICKSDQGSIPDSDSCAPPTVGRLWDFDDMNPPIYDANAETEGDWADEDAPPTLLEGFYKQPPRQITEAEIRRTLDAVDKLDLELREKKNIEEYQQVEAQSSQNAHVDPKLGEVPEKAYLNEGSPEWISMEYVRQWHLKVADSRATGLPEPPGKPNPYMLLAPKTKQTGKKSSSTANGDEASSTPNTPGLFGVYTPGMLSGSNFMHRLDSPAIPEEGIESPAEMTGNSASPCIRPDTAMSAQSLASPSPFLATPNSATGSFFKNMTNFTASTGILKKRETPLAGLLDSNGIAIFNKDNRVGVPKPLTLGFQRVMDEEPPSRHVPYPPSPVLNSPIPQTISFVTQARSKVGLHTVGNVGGGHPVDNAFGIVLGDTVATLSNLDRKNSVPRRRVSFELPEEGDEDTPSSSAKTMLRPIQEDIPEEKLSLLEQLPESKDTLPTVPALEQEVSSSVAMPSWADEGSAFSRDKIMPSQFHESAPEEMCPVPVEPGEGKEVSLSRPPHSLSPSTTRRDSEGHALASSNPSRSPILIKRQCLTPILTPSSAKYLGIRKALNGLRDHLSPDQQAHFDLLKKATMRNSDLDSLKEAETAIDASGNSFKGHGVAIDRLAEQQVVGRRVHTPTPRDDLPLEPPITLSSTVKIGPRNPGQNYAKLGGRQSSVRPSTPETPSIKRSSTMPVVTKLPSASKISSANEIPSASKIPSANKIPSASKIPSTSKIASFSKSPSASKTQALRPPSPQPRKKVVREQFAKFQTPGAATKDTYRNLPPLRGLMSDDLPPKPIYKGFTRDNDKSSLPKPFDRYAGGRMSLEPAFPPTMIQTRARTFPAKPMTDQNSIPERPSITGRHRPSGDSGGANANNLETAAAVPKEEDPKMTTTPTLKSRDQLRFSRGSVYSPLRASPLQSPPTSMTATPQSTTTAMRTPKPTGLRQVGSTILYNPAADRTKVTSASGATPPLQVAVDKDDTMAVKSTSLPRPGFSTMQSRRDMITFTTLTGFPTTTTTPTTATTMNDRVARASGLPMKKVASTATPTSTTSPFLKAGSSPATTGTTTTPPPATVAEKQEADVDAKEAQAKTAARVRAAREKRKEGGGGK